MNMHGMLKALRDEAIELKNAALYVAYSLSWIPYAYVVKPLRRRLGSVTRTGSW